MIGTAKNVNFTRGNNLYIRKQCDWEVPFTVKEGDCHSASPIDLTGYTGICQIRDEKGVLVAEPTVDFSRASEGIFSLVLTEEQTAAIPTTGKSAGEVEIYDYDVVFIHGEDTERVIEGTVQVSPNITDTDTEEDA